MRAFNILIIVFIVGLFFANTKAEGANWIRFYRFVDNSGTHFLDMDSIRYVSNGIGRVWVKQENKPPRVIENIKIKSMLSYIEMDCKNARHRYLQQIKYSVDGREFPFFGKSDWIYNLPNTMPEYLKGKLCK